MLSFSGAKPTRPHFVGDTIAQETSSNTGVQWHAGVELGLWEGDGLAAEQREQPRPHHAALDDDVRERRGQQQQDRGCDAQAALPQASPQCIGPAISRVGSPVSG